MISKGVDWGELRRPVPDSPLAHTDGELRALVVAAQVTGLVLPAIGLLGGDLHRTLGGTNDPARLTGDEPIPHLPIDIVRIIADGERTSYFVAHCVARRSWFRHQIVGAFNAQFLGTWDVSPRCHPNDGKVDVITVEADLGMRQRRMARKRVLLGTHLPHPKISIRQLSTIRIAFDQVTPLWLDGERWGEAVSIELIVEPDALTVFV